jgi:hypothetical protein
MNVSALDDDTLGTTSSEHLKFIKILQNKDQAAFNSNNLYL